MKILAVETSCDDTGIAVLEGSKTGPPKILADLVSSQTKIHAPWGGVVPTLAKREHQRNLVPLLKKALLEANLLRPASHPEPRVSRGEGSPAIACRQAEMRATEPAFAGDSSAPPRNAGSPQNDTLLSILNREPELAKKLLPFLKKYRKPNIDYIAVTVGPGLEPALWVGVNLARALAYFWNLPIIPINHIEGHIAAGFFQVIASPAAAGRSLPRRQAGNPEMLPPSAGLPRPPHQVRGPRNDIFPTICLVVSGGHTQLILIKKPGNYKIIGETRDDAAGEAFDKVAKMLGLGYPGGPAIARIANFHESKFVKISDIKLPRPMLNSGDFDFSFSGLKTALLYQLQKMSPKEIKEKTPSLCAEFQQAVVDVLVSKTIKAAKKFNAQTALLGGGVAANELLRQTLEKQLTKELPAIKFICPAPQFCTDNAAMIGLAAWQKTRQKNFKKENWRKLAAQANWRL